MRLRAEHTDIQQLNWIHLGTVAFFIRIGAHGSRQVHSLMMPQRRCEANYIESSILRCTRNLTIGKALMPQI